MADGPQHSPQQNVAAFKDREQREPAEEEQTGVAEEVNQSWREARTGARKAADAATSEAASLGADIEAAAADAATRAKEEGRDFVHRRKDQAAEELTHFESAVRKASERLRQEEDHRIADYADTIAERISRVAGYLRRQDLDDLVDDVEETARRRPELFLGGLFVAGLATARFLKASSRSRRNRNGDPALEDGPLHYSARAWQVSGTPDSALVQR